MNIGDIIGIVIVSLTFIIFLGIPLVIVYMDRGRILSKGEKERKWFYKKRPIIFYCPYCKCYFEILHAKYFSTYDEDEDEYEHECPECGCNATGKFRFYNDYKKMKDKIAIGEKRTNEF